MYDNVGLFDEPSLQSTKLEKFSLAAILLNYDSSSNSIFIFWLIAIFHRVFQWQKPQGRRTLESDHFPSRLEIPKVFSQSFELFHR